MIQKVESLIRIALCVEVNALLDYILIFPITGL